MYVLLSLLVLLMLAAGIFLFGVAVFLALVAAALWAIRGGMRQRPPQAHVVHDDTEQARRILVVANETVAGDELRDLLGRKAAGVSEDVLLVCPALNSKLRTWTSDEDGAPIVVFPIEDSIDLHTFGNGIAQYVSQ